MIISFIGAPGSGKSTQIARISEYLSEKHKPIILRVPKLINLDKEVVSYLTAEEIETIKQHKELARKSKDEGLLAPIIYDAILFELIPRIKDKSFIILDGMPRGYKQAELFLNIDKVLNQTCFFHLKFIENAYESSVSRQFYRESIKHGVEKAELKLKKFINKYNVYSEDTLSGVSYLFNQGANIYMLNAVENEASIHKQICSSLDRII
ncbi:adenylate kinase family protein [Paenibacillus alkalitolerans]|uniref:hypothetical protein n=1 Tax=Paenibacillus alkalitolerans TaxID=2799335 RepID=UPI0018F57FD6|nr:hypothetical protein [Paenibacillus alkalitolerans]